MLSCILSTERMHITNFPLVLFHVFRQGHTLVVSWLPGNPPQHPKGGGAHRNSASTAPTNNPQVAARYYNQQCVRDRLKVTGEMFS